MIMYCNPVSIGVAADCVIYDAYSFVSSLDYDNSETSQIDFRAVRDLTDMESTKGVTGSIRALYAKLIDHTANFRTLTMKEPFKLLAENCVGFAFVLGLHILFKVLHSVSPYEPYFLY